MVRKQKPKTSLSPLQRNRFLRISIAIIVFSLLGILFMPEKGLYHIRQQKSHCAEIRAEKVTLKVQNDAIKKDIERLQNDQEYLEKVAREDHGMLKKNEMIFDFSRKTKEKK